MRKITTINGIVADGLDLLTLWHRVFNLKIDKILFIKNGSNFVNIITN